MSGGHFGDYDYYKVYQFADIDTGKVETIPLTEDFFDRLKDLVKDVAPEDENETN